MMKMRAYWVNKRFFDYKKFPYGFSRSGIFSLVESELLESRGCLLQALMAQSVFDPTEADLAFVKAMKRGDSDFSLDTKVWSKYLGHQRRLISISGGWLSPISDADNQTINQLDSDIESNGEWMLAENQVDDNFLKAG